MDTAKIAAKAVHISTSSGAPPLTRSVTGFPFYRFENDEIVWRDNAARCRINGIHGLPRWREKPRCQPRYGALSQTGRVSKIDLRMAELF
jgi:hypothetical protein